MGDMAVEDSTVEVSLNFENCFHITDYTFLKVVDTTAGLEVSI